MAEDHVFGSQESDTFFRLYGDMDGDRDVDWNDYGYFGDAFYLAMSDPGFDTRLDFDGDGNIDAKDYAQFRRRLFGSLRFR